MKIIDKMNIPAANQNGVHYGHAVMPYQNAIYIYGTKSDSTGAKAVVHVAKAELVDNKMSEEFVETLEDVVAYRISLTDLLRLFQTNIELANWGRVIHQNEYRRLHRSHKDRLTLSAKERYEAFKLQFPQMCQRIQLGYIASYLGITLSTLSRLRAYK